MDSHTGVGGFTLGGGVGRLNRKFGLAIDNLRSAGIVTADGRIHRISEKDQPDLFWAIRGGGGNFGIVTEFDYHLHPLAETMLVFASLWNDPAEDKEAIGTTRDWYNYLAPFIGGYYQNIEFEIDDSAQGNYGPAYERLSQVKGQYDPRNLFRLNSNVRPGA